MFYTLRCKVLCVCIQACVHTYVCLNVLTVRVRALQPCRTRYGEREGGMRKRHNQSGATAHPVYATIIRHENT
jgi:hypothetical protein